MNDHCIYCEAPRHPRHDRPGKFFSMCYDHRKAYMRQKNNESYMRHQTERVQNSRNYRQNNRTNYQKSYRKYEAKPEVQERKRAYMRLYNSPYRINCKNACEICGYETRDSKFKRDLDVHHIDGNHSNNDPTNLQTLCAPCHRLL